MSSDRRIDFAILPGVIGRIYAKRYYIDRVNDVLVNRMRRLVLRDIEVLCVWADDYRSHSV